MPIGIHVILFISPAGRIEVGTKRTSPVQASPEFTKKFSRTTATIYFLGNFFTVSKFYNIDYQRFEFYFGKLCQELTSSNTFIW